MQIYAKTCYKKVYLLCGFDRTISTVPQGRHLDEITFTVLLDWQNLRNRSSIKRNIGPAAIAKIKSPICKAINTIKIMYNW